MGGVTCASQEFIDGLKNLNSGASILLGPTMDSLRSANVMKKLRTLHIRMKQHILTPCISRNVLKRMD